MTRSDTLEAVAALVPAPSQGGPAEVIACPVEHLCPFRPKPRHHTRRPVIDLVEGSGKSCTWKGPSLHVDSLARTHRTHDVLKGYHPTGPILLARGRLDRRAGNGILIEGYPPGEVYHTVIRLRDRQPGRLLDVTS